MRFTIPKLSVSPQYFLRTCSYIEIHNPHKNDEISYARSLDPGRFYPRFHIYLENANGETMISMHLDMKKPSYEGSSAHSGEYEGTVVEEEKRRLLLLAKGHLSEQPHSLLGFQKKKSWIKRLFG